MNCISKVHTKLYNAKIFTGEPDTQFVCISLGDTKVLKMSIDDGVT